MASIRKEISTSATPEQVWDALRDVGALHTRLVPGFVTDTRMEPGARIVTFGNGKVVREFGRSLEMIEVRLLAGRIRRFLQALHECRQRQLVHAGLGFGLDAESTGSNHVFFSGCNCRRWTRRRD